MDSRLKKHFPELNQYLESEVETKDGKILLYHCKPLEQNIIDTLKKLTSEEVIEIVKDLGFESHKL
jgi:hypothetical protein